MGLVKSLAKEMIKDIGNKSREFYEFVLPPVDMYLDNDKLKIIIDIPGFAKKDIKLSLDENILTIKASKEILDKKNIICNQRPNIIDKKMRLPIELDEGEEIHSAKYEDGVLTIIIPVKKHGKDISIE
ncbi:MAG: archaeal heat shock protein Hsp14 [Nitrosarchaeum sp.]